MALLSAASVKTWRPVGRAMLTLLLQQPSPEVAVGGGFAVDLHVDHAVIQRIELRAGQFDRSAEAAARGFGDGEIADDGSAHALDPSTAKLRNRGRSVEPFERPGNRQRVPREIRRR